MMSHRRVVGRGAGGSHCRDSVYTRLSHSSHASTALDPGPDDLLTGCVRGFGPRVAAQSLAGVYAARDLSRSLLQRLIDVGDDVPDILDPYRQPDEVVRHSRGFSLFGAELLMGGARGVNHQRSRVSDVG